MIVAICVSCMLSLFKTSKTQGLGLSASTTRQRPRAHQKRGCQRCSFSLQQKAFRTPRFELKLALVITRITIVTIIAITKGFAVYLKSPRVVLLLLVLP